MSRQSSDSAIYLGEPAERKFWVAWLLSLMMPGLGHLYMGRPVKTVLIQGFWLGSILVGCGSLIWAQIFLFKVLAALAALWLVLQGWLFFILPDRATGRTNLYSPILQFPVDLHGVCSAGHRTMGPPPDHRNRALWVS